MKFHSTLSYLFWALSFGAVAQSSTQPMFPSQKSENIQAYFSENEKEVLRLCNLARTNGPAFVATYLNGHANDTSCRFTASLIQTLAKSKPLNPLSPVLPLCRSAYMHAKDMGSNGLTGYKSSDGQPFYDRIHQYFPGATMFAENYHSGTANPIEIVLALLINKDDPNLQSRSNILSPDLEVIGISIQSHKKLCTNTVIDFAKKPQVVSVSNQANYSDKAYYDKCPPGTKIRVRKKKLGLW